MSKPFEIILKPTHTDAQITPDQRLIHVKRVSEKTYSETYGQFSKKSIEVLMEFGLYEIDR